MAICDSKLYFSRDVKVIIEVGTERWEIPVLDGFSFAQANNSSEIVLAEMENTIGVSRRGKRMFNDSLAPAEWSFTTYTRPFKSAGADSGDLLAATTTAGEVHAVEEVLWALAAGKANRTDRDDQFWGPDQIDGSPQDYFIPNALVDTTINFQTSNTSALGTANIYFILEEQGLTYKIRESAVNEVTINFDIDGIAQLEWSGMGAEIVDEPTTIAATINEGVLDTDNFIRNRLTALAVIPRKNADITIDIVAGVISNPTVVEGGNGYENGTGQTVTLNSTSGGGTVDAILTYDVVLGVVGNPVVSTPGSGYVPADTTDVTIVELQTGTYTTTQENLLADNYDLTLTGGSITVSNNLTYITPEELGIVNIPIGHVTGTRSVSGTFTNYLVKDPNNALSNDSSGFWEDTKALTTVVTHDFRLEFSVGGLTAAAGSPTVDFIMPHCHIEIPTHNIEDVIALETSFSALGTCISAANEVAIKYTAV